MSDRSRSSSVAPNQSTYDDAVCRSPGPTVDPTTGATVQGSDLTDRAGEIRTATQDLGQQRNLGSGFTRTAGSVLDALMPNEGDKGKIQVNVNIPIDQSGTIRVSFEFIAEAERDDKGVKGRIQVGGGVTATTSTDLYFVTVEAFARGMVFGYLESYGDSSAQMFDLMLLGIQQRLAGASQRIADAVFDAQQIRTIIRNMDDDDYVESGLGVSVEAGVSASAGTGADEESVGAGAGASGQMGTRLTSNGRGGLRSQDMRQAQVAVSGSATPFALGGKLAGKWQDGRFNAVEAELSGEAMLDAGQLNEVVIGGRWLSGVIGQLGGIVSGSAGMLNDQDSARRIGGLASFIHGASGTGVLAEAASARALSQLQGMGVNMGHKLTVKGTWEDGKGYGFELALERVSQIEFGENSRALVYVLVENVQRVFRIKLGG